MLFQVPLTAPRRIPFLVPARRIAAKHTDAGFSHFGREGCHIKELTLETRWFAESHPHGPAGNLTLVDTDTPAKFHLVARSESNLVQHLPADKPVVRTLPDLKRHDLNNDDYDYFANKKVPQGALAGFADRENSRLRRTLGHLAIPGPKAVGRGQRRLLRPQAGLTTLTGAIFCYSEDARTQRVACFNLRHGDQGAVTEFSKSLVVVP